MLTLGLNPSGVATEKDTFNWSKDATEYVRVRVEGEDLFFDYCKRGLPGVSCNVSMTYGAEDWEPTPHGWLITDHSLTVKEIWSIAAKAAGTLFPGCGLVPWPRSEVAPTR